MKRLFFVSVLVVLVGVLIFTGCAQPTPPTQAPTSTPGQTPKPSGPPAREPVALAIYGQSFGSGGYVAAFVLSDIINKYSTWLRASAIETGGATYNNSLFEKEPKLRKASICIQTFMGSYMGKVGIEPYGKYTGNLKALFQHFATATGLMARDPNIKTGRDLAGKKIGLADVGSNAHTPQLILMKQVWNVWDKVNVQYLGYNGSPQALQDGTIDVSLWAGTWAGGKVVPNPGFLPLAQSPVDFHYLSIAEEDWAAAREKTGFPFESTPLAPGTLPKQKQETAGASRDRNGFWADAELPDDIAYEVCRVVYEHSDAFGAANATLKDLSPTTVAMEAADESYFHPGAIKFYKEKGVKIGFK